MPMGKGTYGSKKGRPKKKRVTAKAKKKGGHGKSLAGVAKKTGIPLGILRQVYKRGQAAYRTGHRPGASQAAWAMARVHSFATKSPTTWGKADADLAKKARARMKR